MLASINMELITCCSCKVPFAVTEHHIRKLQTDATEFYCPNGHRQVYNNSEVTRLKTEVSTLRAENFKLKNAEKSAAKAVAEAARVAGEMVRIPARPDYKGIPRGEYVWAKEDKDKLVAMRQQNPELPWSEIGKRLGKKGTKCASMYHGMKCRGQIPQKEGIAQ